MTRFDQRERALLRNQDVAAGYREMEAELSLVRAIDIMRERQHISKEQLAARMQRHRAAVSRVLNDDESNPTLDTITELLDALDLAADITVRRKITPDEAPIRVDVAP